MIRAVILVVLALATAVASGERTRFYKWVDEEGVVHYSDQRPDHERYEEIITQEPDTRPLPDPAEAVEAEVEATEASDLTEDEARQANCANARETLAALLAAEQVLMDLDGDGRDELLSEAQRQLQIARYRREANQYCDD